MKLPLLTVTVARERDVVAARQRARQLAQLLGFDTQDQTRLATAVSEIARNAWSYAGGGTLEFSVEGQSRPQILLVRVADRGPGIADLDAVLSGRYRSSTGMGLGIVGSKRLMDAFEIQTSPAGTTVLLRKLVPSRAPLVNPARAAAIVDTLARLRADDPLAEVLDQNRELLATLEELGRRRDDLLRLNAELEDTNRGVVALYAELDEKADHLRRADELKSKFLSNMSHEFRTPLNSILALSRLLLDHVDGPLTAEQERQVAFIRRGAEELSELVNDLLDLAKVEAGKIVLRPSEFEVDKLFGALRGMLRPVLIHPGLALVFEDVRDIPPMVSDEAKVSQILRNFISNALKFTERGEIRVSARLTDDGGGVVFAVRDTGIGIAPEDRDRIFEEFTQIEHAVQRRVKGTGLGLPLTRKLARLLGGDVAVESEVGVGSTFTLTLPLVFVPPPEVGEGGTAAGAPRVTWEPDPARGNVLVVDPQGDPATWRDLVRASAFQVVCVRTPLEAHRVLARMRPRAVVVVPARDDDELWRLLAYLKREAETAAPVLAVTDADDRDQALALGADACLEAPASREALLAALRGCGDTGRRVLIIDDDDAARYLLRSLLRDVPIVVAEAGNGAEGLEMARAQRPDLIFCDLYMPAMSGLEVLDRLQDDPATRGIPVVVSTVGILDAGQRDELARRGIHVLLKERFVHPGAAAEVHRLLTEAGVTP